MQNAIEIKDLVKTYGKSRGVSKVSITVTKGDFYGFIGPNGAGKSTTIRSILGLIKKIPVQSKFWVWISKRKK